MHYHFTRNLSILIDYTTQINIICRIWESLWSCSAKNRGHIKTPCRYSFDSGEMI